MGFETVEQRTEAFIVSCVHTKPNPRQMDDKIEEIFLIFRGLQILYFLWIHIGWPALFSDMFPLTFSFPNTYFFLFNLSLTLRLLPLTVSLAHISRVSLNPPCDLIVGCIQINTEG